MVGHMLGTADLIAQMSDRCYLEKCYERLYVEFVLAGIAIKVDKNGKEHTIYASPEDLLRKTPVFFESEVKTRLNKIFNQVYLYEDIYFKDQYSYIQDLQKNQDRLAIILEADDFNLLRQKPPENYGTQTFPGLDIYLNQHPPQKTLLKAR